MIDWARVRELYEEIGADAFEEVLDLFCEEVAEGLISLEAATTPADQSAAFHFLKGAALNLGIDDISRQCAQGEATNATGTLDAAACADVLAGFPLRMDALQDGWRAAVQAEA
ncbi:MAG: Hpt domain-containing protein [Rhodobacteraceae bacterium]|nr:Hpt domain-containing protein [Paracoccaceae bacterium]